MARRGVADHRLRTLIAAAACAAFGCGIFAKGDPRARPLFEGDDDPLLAFDQARIDLAAGRLEGALLRLRELRVLRPEEIAVRRALQDALLEAGRADEARGEALADVDREGTASALALYARVAATPEEADEAIARALAVDAEDPAALHGKAGALLRESAVAEASAILDALASDEPAYLPARVDRAALRFEEGNPAGAIRDLEEVLRVDPGDLESRRALAAIRLGTEDAEGAEKDFRALLGVLAEDRSALFGLAACHAALGDGRRALAVYERIARIDPEDPRLLFSLGVLRQEHLGDPAGAAEAYRACLASPRATASLSWSQRIRARVWLEEIEGGGSAGSETAPAESAVAASRPAGPE